MKTIYVDRNVRKKDYEHLGPQQLAVTSFFSTLQGEGPFAGERALFIRLAGCNFGGKGVNGPGCPFCDTDFRFDYSSVYSFGEILNIITNHPGPMLDGRRLVVITGGEPLLQPNLPDFLDRVSGQLTPDEWLFQIETNGTVAAKIPDHVYLVVSPKIPEGGKKEPQYGRIPDGIFNRADCLKMLVSADIKSPYHKLPNWVPVWTQIKERPVYLSPINVYRSEPDPGNVRTNIWNDAIYDTKQCAENHRYAAELCLKYGYRLSVQTHLFVAFP